MKRLRLRPLLLLACLCCRVTHAQQPGAPGASPAQVEAPAADQALDGATPPPLRPGENASPIAPQRATVDPQAEQRRLLSLRLDEVDAEIESTSTFLPWLVFATGAALLVTGVTIGSLNAADCSGSCSTPFWPSWAVTGGATIGIGGLVWLRLVEDDIAQLGSKRYQLLRDLERLELERD